MTKKPSSLAKDILLTLCIKGSLFFSLWWICFRPHPALVETLQHHLL
ncbi:MAG: hypothetical protein NTW08_04170 [Gammaproteobacteria bacterium]|nr:hypothetical protein [Gammaproteobacteria bacterium]